MPTLFVRLAFIIPALWWVYLLLCTQIVVVYDSIGYEHLGRMIYEHGWVEFFRNGPNREPFFPALISVSMWLGEIFKVSYYYPLKMFGAVFLLLTMLAAYRLMRMIDVHRAIATLAVFYLGISPVMTNSSMRLWSEFAAYPWVMLAVLWTIISCRKMEHWPLDRTGTRRAVIHGLVLGGLFFLIMCVKAVAEGVLIFYLWPLYYQAYVYIRSKDLARARQVMVFCLAALVIFECGTFCVKFANQYYNGNFAFTDRGHWALYGNTARRMQPMTLTHLGTAVASVSGVEICTNFFTAQECDFWSASYSDELTAQKFRDLKAQDFPEKEQPRYFIGESLRLILSNPFQAAAMMLIEVHRMFFWESAIAFVAYPAWLEHIFYSTGPMNALKVVFAFFSWGACIFTAVYVWRRKGQGALWVINFIFWYMAMYSLFFVVDRYAFPLISLYMVLIAFTIDRTFHWFKTRYASKIT